MSEDLGMSISAQIDVSAYRGLSSFTRRQVSVAPSNLSVYTSSNSIGDMFFDLPSASRSLINGEQSFLCFDLAYQCTIAGAGTAALANGNAGSLISVLESVVQNQTVETLQNYNVYANILYDLQSKDRQTGMCSILNGANETNYETGANILGGNNAYGTTLRCSIPLHSAIFGTGQSNFMMALSGMRLKLGMSPTDVAFVAGDAVANTYRLQNISLKLEYLDMSDAVYRQLLDEAGGVFKVHGTGVSNFQTATALSASQSLLIPARFSSVKSLLTCFRLSSDIATPITFNSVGSRKNPLIGTYTYQIDGRNMNPVPVRVGLSAANYLAGEAVAEVAGVFNAISSNQFEIVGPSSKYLTTGGAALNDTFIMGMNFEEHSTTGGNAVVGGIDTNSSNTFLQITNTAVAVSGYTADTFCMYDIVLSADMVNGTISLSK
jgi:hypothetical protein